MNATNRGVEQHEQIMRAGRTYAETASGTQASKLPERALFVLTCMDARVDPLRILGLDLGDAHVVRNAGGRVTADVVRSLVLSSVLLGTRHVAVIHHTDCGLQAPSDAHVHEQLRDRGVDVGDMAIGTFDDVDESVRDDVAALAGDPLVETSMTVSGYVYDVGTRELRTVTEPTA